MLINQNDELQFIGKKENGQTLNGFVVDDSVAMVKIVSRTLNGFGINVLGSASNGDEAVKSIEQIPEDVDLITLDITMPVKDGLSVLPDLKKLRPDARIIMVSALGDKNRVIQAMQMGANYYIVKPFRKDTFYTVLRRVFSQ